MFLIKVRAKIKSVSKRWDSAYGKTLSEDKIAIGNKLRELDGETATAEEVAKIIGNDSWTFADTCDECGATVDGLVQLGEAPDYESSTACICLNCLEKAVAIAKAGK